MEWTPQILTGWGRISHAKVGAARPEDASAVVSAVTARHARGVIAYGEGRSYGDAPLNDGGQTILTSGFNKVVSFDDKSGNVICESGVTFRDLLEIFLPRGYLPAVTPGTSFATIGGAVANDVHGKNHDRVGSFGDNIFWLELVLASGEIVRVSHQSMADLFAATVGGIGLTGIILRICFRMTPVPSRHVAVREERMPDLDAFFSALETSRRQSTFSVGWIDGLARGVSLGRGILETAELAEHDVGDDRPRTSRNVPFDFPGFILNPVTIKMFNQFYYSRIPASGRHRTVPVERFLYPLDALNNWNRIYGKRGFYQFQCVLPDVTAREGIERLLEQITQGRMSSFLAVLKTLGGPGKGDLSFPLRGYTLALDFPRRRGIRELLLRLERTTLDYGGRIYLAKDAALSPEGFARMYPKIDHLREVLDRYDPNARFQSDMARRLRIRG